MTSAAPTAFPFAQAVEEAAVDASVTWAYRRQARRLRDRFRHDAAALHASLKSLATETDAAAPPRRPVRSAVRARSVVSRIVVPIGDPAAADALVGDPVGRSAGRTAVTPFVAPPPAYGQTPAGPESIVDVGPTVRGVLNASPAAIDELATLARAALAEGPIGFSRRQKLIRRADDLRIGRFEASLIVAAVEHRHRTYAPTATVSLPPIRKRTVGLVVAIALLIELVALAALSVL